MTVLIVGTAGAEPERLAAALREAGLAEAVVADLAGGADHADADASAAVLALDSSMPAADEEDEILAALATAAIPTALVACSVESFPNWPSVLAASRARLDPDHRLPVFATSVALAAEPDSSSGVPELASWCSADHGADHRPAWPPPSGAPRTAPTSAGGGSAALRAERITGLRAGIVAARAEASSSLRAALVEVAKLVPDACAAPDFVDWLPPTVEVVEQRARVLFEHRLMQVRAAATCGLIAGGGVAMPLDLVDSSGSQPPPRRRARPEDVMVLLVGASMGFGVGRVVLEPTFAWAGLGAAGTVLSLVAGLLIALWVVSVRRTAADRARRERWAVELIAARRTAVEHWIGTCAGAAEAHTSREIWNRTRPARV